MVWPRFRAKKRSQTEGNHDFAIQNLVFYESKWLPERGFSHVSVKKHTCFTWFRAFAGSKIDASSVSAALGRPWAPKARPRAPKSRPRRPRSGPGAAPRAPKSHPRAPKSRPRAAQERPRAPKTRPRAAKIAQERPRRPRSGPKRPPRGPRRPESAQEKPIHAAKPRAQGTVENAVRKYWSKGLSKPLHARSTKPHRLSGRYWGRQPHWRSGH